MYQRQLLIGVLLVAPLGLFNQPQAHAQSIPGLSSGSSLLPGNIGGLPGGIGGLPGGLNIPGLPGGTGGGLPGGLNIPGLPGGAGGGTGGLQGVLQQVLQLPQNTMNTVLTDIQKQVGQILNDVLGQTTGALGLPNPSTTETVILSNQDSQKPRLPGINPIVVNQPLPSRVLAIAARQRVLDANNQNIFRGVTTAANETANSGVPLVSQAQQMASDSSTQASNAGNQASNAGNQATQATNAATSASQSSGTAQGKQSTQEVLKAGVQLWEQIAKINAHQSNQLANLAAGIQALSTQSSNHNATAALQTQLLENSLQLSAAQTTLQGETLYQGAVQNDNLNRLNEQLHGQRVDQIARQNGELHQSLPTLERGPVLLR